MEKENSTICIPLKHKVEQHCYGGQNSGTLYFLHAKG